MPTIRQFLQGRHWTSAVLTPVSVGADGTTTEVTANAMTLTTVVKSNNKSLRINTVNITPVNQVLTAFAGEEDDWSLSCGVLQVNDTSSPNPIWEERATYSYFKLVLVEGTKTGSTGTYTFYGIMNELDAGIEGKGEQIASFSLQSVGIVPTYSVA